MACTGTANLFNSVMLAVEVPFMVRVLHLKPSGDIVWGTMPLGALLGGVLGTWLGLRPAVWIAVVGSYAAALWVFFSPLRTMRDVPFAPDPTSDPA